MNRSFRSLLRFSLLTILLVLGASCKGNKNKASTGFDDGVIAGGDVPEGDFFGMDDGSMLGDRSDLEGMEAVDSTAFEAVYFGFDSSSIAPGEMIKVEQMAGYLMGSTATIVVVNGHTDDRGSREYNLALGERRALAVREALIMLGVSADQVQTLSMGEEEPAVMGEGEGSWSLNRRAEFQLMQ